MPFTLKKNTITAYSRIDNRPQLIRKFNLTQLQENEIPDSLLILKAYEKWGEACVHHLEGDWCFAIWDDELKKLFLSMDPMGNMGIYYYQSSDYFIFCSSFKGLAAISEIPKQPNDLFIAGILTVCKPPDGATAHKNIFNLLPATNLIVQNNKVTKDRYWQLEETPLIHYSSSEEYIEHFLEIYNQSIRERIHSHGTVGSMLSGGLDSGSVSALTALQLKEKNMRLNAYTHVPLYDISGLYGPNTFGNETEYARSTANFSGNIDIHFIRGEHTNLLESLYKALDLHDAPIHAVSNALWINELLQTAKSHGVTTLLTGQGGNGSISWTGLPDPETLQSLLRKYHKNKIVLKSLIGGITRLIIPLKQIKKSVILPENLPISAALQNRTQINTLKEKWTKNTLGIKKEAIHRRCIMLSTNHSMGTLWLENGYGYGLHISDPTRDKELASFCLSIPDQFYKNPDYDRLIIRQAMEGILPPDVQWNKLKGAQSADVLYRFRTIAPKIKEIISEFEQSPILKEYLDLPKMEKLYHSITEGKIELQNNIKTHVLLRSVGIGLYLKKHI